MKKFINPVYITYIVLLTLAFVFSLSTWGQTIKRNGNTFIELPSDSSKVTKKSEAKKTDMIYIDSKGISYPIYLSSTGKAFIKKKSKRTGKEYRKYLPEVTKQLKK